jgi:hypothetical protein
MISERSKSRHKNLIESVHEEKKHANNQFLIMPKHETTLGFMEEKIT